MVCWVIDSVSMGPILYALHLSRPPYLSPVMLCHFLWNPCWRRCFKNLFLFNYIKIKTDIYTKSQLLIF